MDHLMKLVTTALELSYVQGEKNVNPDHLEAAAEALTLRRNTIYLIDTDRRNEKDNEQKEEPPSEPNPK